MGMYTGLRGTIVIKQVFIGQIANLIHGSYEWEDNFGDHLSPEMEEWLDVDRRRFIPFGAVCYMPDDWGEAVQSFDEATGTLTFTCSLKNYGQEIDVFINMLPTIAVSWELEELYEENEDATHHSSYPIDE